MCGKCIELDNKTAHYRRMASQITDQQTLDGIDGLIRQMKAAKAAIRCDPGKT